MKLLGTSKLEIKKSKFLGFCYEVTTMEEVDSILDDLKKEHKKARHIPYAVKLINTARKSDDKEPSGTAGMPILNILELNHEENKMIAVIRYFGGVKLGSGLLLRSYKDAAKLALDDAKINNLNE